MNNLVTQENKEKGMEKKEKSLHNLWVMNKCTNIRITVVPEGEKRE